MALNDSVMRSKNNAQPEIEKQLLMTKAQPFLEKAIELCKKNNDKTYESIYTGGLADLAAAKGDYKNAFTYFKQADKLDDSIHSQDLKNEIAGVEGKYKLSIKNKEIEISNLALSVQKKQRMGLFACVALFAMMGGLFYWQKISYTIPKSLHNQS
ncbi:MAG: tetratricopeptide repeat protein [Chitinophagaceae bacterium]